MELITTLPKTDLTPYLVDTSLNKSSYGVSGAGLYLLYLSNGNEYFEDLLNSPIIDIPIAVMDSYHRIKAYYELNFTTKISNSGTILNMVTGFSHNELAQNLQHGMRLLKLTHSPVRVPEHSRVTIDTSESIYLKEYLTNKKIHHVGVNIEMLVIQEYIAKYAISDANILVICRLLEMENINKNYAILADTNVLTLHDTLFSDSYPNAVEVTITDENWKMMVMLNRVLGDCIKEI